MVVIVETISSWWSVDYVNWLVVQIKVFSLRLCYVPLDKTLEGLIWRVLFLPLYCIMVLVFHYTCIHSKFSKKNLNRKNNGRRLISNCMMVSICNSAKKMNDFLFLLTASRKSQGSQRASWQQTLRSSLTFTLVLLLIWVFQVETYSPPSEYKTISMCAIANMAAQQCRGSTLRTSWVNFASSQCVCMAPAASSSSSLKTCTLGTFARSTRSPNCCLYLRCGPAIIWRLVEGVTPPLSDDSRDQLQ